MVDTGVFKCGVDGPVFLINDQEKQEDKIMPKVRKEIPELERMVQTGRKKFVRYEEGAKLYSMGLHTFQQLAKDAKAVYHVKRVVLVNTEVIDEYLENFRDEF